MHWKTRHHLRQQALIRELRDRPPRTEPAPPLSPVVERLVARLLGHEPPANVASPTAGQE